ncbi:hypothetical protein DFJ73DRAFT_756894 [Zopfochytrium polystomum]|nr:hypothetical protein DFJ73DRAFT_756894 [Zopfochytrium polystomum]
MDFLPYVLSPSLRELHLSGIASNDVLHSVSSRLMPELEILRLTECSGLTDETMISIAGRCQGLRVLDVWGSVHVTDAGISAFATPDHVINDDLQNSIPPSRGASLEAVDITYTAVTDRGISVLSACPRLHTVFMEGISCSVDSIIELIKKCGPRLRELILCGCLERQNGTAEFELLVAGEPEAEERRAPAGWPFGRDGGIDTGASHSAPGPPAESMDTRMDQEQSSTSSSMSDVERTLFSLAEHCPNLVQLDVVACGDRICGSAVLAVLRSCSSLRTFAVEESAVGSTMWRWMKEKSGYEVEGVFVSPFWGVNF